MYLPDPKPIAARDKKYLTWIKSQPCAKCGQIPPSFPAHQRIAGGGGEGLKPSDYEALPLCDTCHKREHMGAISFWNQGSKEATRDYVRELFKIYRERFLKEIENV